MMNNTIVYFKLDREVVGIYDYCIKLNDGTLRSFKDDGTYVDYSDRYDMYYLTDDQMSMYDDSKSYILTSDFQLKEHDGFIIDDFDNVL